MFQTKAPQSCPSKLSITIQVPSQNAACKLAQHQALNFDHNYPPLKLKKKYFSPFNMGHSAETSLLLENGPDAAQQIEMSAIFAQMGNNNGEGFCERLEHEIQIYNERWGEYEN